jgi:hypothetical protein
VDRANQQGIPGVPILLVHRRVAIYVILGVIVAQVIFVNVVFVIYLVKNDWHP